jgi:hypothetical protein
MRKWASALALLAGLAFAEPALADSPAAVYSDFAEDGVLSCGHSRPALKGVLNDASLHQYGDPLTFIQLKLAIRKQLASGCRRRIASRRPAGSTGSAAPDESNSGPGSSSASGSPRPRQGPPSSDEPVPPATEQGPKTNSDDSKQSGGMLLVGVGLLLLTLGSGGWAARRAFDNRQ